MVKNEGKEKRGRGGRTRGGGNSPPDDFLVARLFEVLVVPAARGCGAISSSIQFTYCVTHLSLSARMVRSPRGRVSAPRASGDHGMEPTPKCWKRERIEKGQNHMGGDGEFFL